MACGIGSGGLDILIIVFQGSLVLSLCQLHFVGLIVLRRLEANLQHTRFVRLCHLSGRVTVIRVRQHSGTLDSHLPLLCYLLHARHSQVGPMRLIENDTFLSINALHVVVVVLR